MSAQPAGPVETTDAAIDPRKGDDPVVSAKPYREVTGASVVLGILVGVALTVSFTYAGLKLGFIVPASMVAAMLGWGVLRKGLRIGSIVENNINQTVAAAVNVSSGGVIFTVPVLYLMSTQKAAASDQVRALAQAAGTSVDAYVASHPELQSIDPKMLWSIVAASLAGSFLGVLFIIPSRKQMIDLERLVFPSGVATAAILKASGSGPRRFRWLMTGIAASILFAVVTGLPNVVPSLPWPALEDFDLGEILHVPAHTAIVIAIAGGLTSLGGGYITGRAGLVLMVGAVVAHWIVTPLVVTRGWMPEAVARQLGERAIQAAAKGAGGATPELVAHVHDGLAAGWSYKNVARPLGIGMLLGGSLASVVLTAPMLKSALASIQKQRKAGAGQGSQEMNPALLYVGVIGGFVVLAAAGFLAAPDANPGRLLLAALVATVWMWLANIIVSITTGKTDNSPLSGMALITIVLIVLMLGREGAIVALIMAVAVCVATSQGSDMMQDLKTGHLVGAVPRRQQMTQLAVAWIGPLVSIATLLVLAKKFVFGVDPLTAPQGQAIKAALELFAPPDGADAGQAVIAHAVKLRYVAGTATGLLLTLGAGGGLGVVLGLAMYLPMAVTLTYCIGCALAWVSERWKGKEWVDDVGVPLAAGFLVGEGLAQVALVAWDLARVAGGA
jgi:OPT family oligopeptide transporter